jgi:hypothetical protein
VRGSEVVPTSDCCCGRSSSFLFCRIMACEVILVWYELAALPELADVIALMPVLLFRLVPLVMVLVDITNAPDDLCVLFWLVVVIHAIIIACYFILSILYGSKNPLFINEFFSTTLYFRGSLGLYPENKASASHR